MKLELCSQSEVGPWEAVLSAGFFPDPCQGALGASSQAKACKLGALFGQS